MTTRNHPSKNDSTRWSDLGALALIALLTVGTVLVAACGGGGAPGPANPAVQKGKAVFDRVCATCHGKDANGLPKLGKNLHDNAFTEGLSDAELVEFLKKGRTATHPLNETGVDMPPKGGDPSISDEDLVNVVAFLRTL